MIEKSTVLVLGAGASVAYGYPTGSDLVENIKTKTNPNQTSVFFDDLLYKYGIKDRKTISKFNEALHLSDPPSIDEFLSHRQEFIEIGKLLIAMELIPCEYKQSLFDREIKNLSWYKSLYDKLRAPEVKLFNKNKLSIITFNYDRSLEHYLFTVTKNTYGINDTECSEIVSSIPILHVYGMLDELPWQIEGGRPYGQGATPNQIKQASDRIFILSEDREGSIIFDHAFSLLEKAQVVYFLGFGYHDMNLKRLKIDKVNEFYVKQTPNKPIDQTRRPFFGTSYGLGISDIDLICRKWPIIKIPSVNKNIMDFFKDHARWS